MNKIKITIRLEDVVDVKCSILFVKHIEGFLSMPEKALNDKMAGKNNVFMKHEKDPAHLLLDPPNLSISKLNIINFHHDDLPFTYLSVDNYARQMIRYCLSDAEPEPVSAIATAVHGPGAGLDSSEAMERMIIAFAKELQGKESFNGLKEIIFIEKDETVFERLKERITFLVKQDVLVYERSKTYLEIDQKTKAKSASKAKPPKQKENHIFVAMPFDRNFDDVYLFGIKQAIEKNGRVSERVDQQFFSGDIIERMLLRIGTADLLVADISGNNPNVFYEVGLAEGMGISIDKLGISYKSGKKKIIYITQDEKAPFDIQGQNRIHYNRFAIHELEENLRQAIQDVLNESNDER